jgi:Ca2+-binding EF-hand superfamily protein
VLTTVAQSTKNPTPTIEGAAEAGSTVTVYDGETSLGATVASSSGVWSFTPATPLDAGDHSITAKSQDYAGNVSLTSAAITLTVIPLTPEERADALLGNYGGTEKGYVEIADILNAWINNPSQGDVRELANTMQAWDADGDGKITRKEIVTNFKVMDAADGLLLSFAKAPSAPTDPVAIRLDDVTDADLQPLGLTHELLASWDLDENDAVTRAELIIGLQPLIDRPPTAAEIAQAMLNQYDADHNNALSLNEFQNALGGAANASQGDFDSWDLNKDQSISLDEIATGVDAIQKASDFVAQYARSNHDYFDITDIQAAINASPNKDKMAPAEEILAAWDMDGDGKVTIQEVMTIQQLNKSTPTTP